MTGTRNFIIFVVGIAMIGAGFYALARGSLTLAPILLVAGYCAAIPVGIMTGGRGGSGRAERNEERANSSVG